MVAKLLALDEKQTDSVKEPVSSVRLKVYPVVSYSGGISSWYSSMELFVLFSQLIQSGNKLHSTDLQFVNILD